VIGQLGNRVIWYLKREWFELLNYPITQFPNATQPRFLRNSAFRCSDS
jgi:hypothetical protein